MNHDPKSYFLFDPQRSHFTNALSIYKACKRELVRKHYGQVRKLKPNKREMLNDDES
jgi:methylase of polypeptide subunit release factors